MFKLFFSGYSRRFFFSCFFLISILSPLFADGQDQKQSESQIVKMTWVDFAFINHYPVKGTRFADFSDYNLGGEIRANYMFFGIEPLWVSVAYMTDWNKTNSNRLDRIIDIGASLGVGWRFRLGEKYSFTPRVSYGHMLHVTHGDYYNAPDIYPGDPRAGQVKTRLFSDPYLQYEFEFARAVSSSSGSFRGELFAAPSFIHFVEKKRQGLEIGYLAGIRMKMGDSAVSDLGRARITGKVIDSETGAVLSGVTPAVSGGNSSKMAPSAPDTFAFEVEAGTDYTLKAEKSGYDPVSAGVSASDLPVNGSRGVVMAMTPSKEWGLIGHVFDKDTNEPLRDVDVTVTSPDGKTEKYATDKSGDFKIAIRPDGDYVIYLRKKGYFVISCEFPAKGKKPGWYDLRNFMHTDFQKAVVGAQIEFANIFYDTGSAVIRNDAKTGLNQIIRFLKDNEFLVVELGAHTDSRGDAKQNMNLSQRRAESAVAYLSKNGIDSSRVSAKGYGESRIKNRCVDGVNCSEEEHQQNRRTELTVQQILSGDK
jgi:outer membrane protein OmpA-like peptidoglycan-associated protein